MYALCSLYVCFVDALCMLYDPFDVVMPPNNPNMDSYKSDLLVYFKFLNAC